MSTLLLNLRCSICNEIFPINPKTYCALGLDGLPKRCPRCQDKKQNRPVEVLSRKAVEEWHGVLVAEMPVKFVPFIADENKGDVPSHRAIIKGSIGDGVSWNGRMDVWSIGHTDPTGKVCDIRLMEVIRNRKIQVPQRGPDGKILYLGEERLMEEKLIEGEVQQYLVLEPADNKPSGLQFVFLRANRKTTLKGLGRQFHASLNLETALWSYRLESYCRSGRYGSLMALAIVSDEHPAYEKVWGDIKRERRYPLQP